MRSQVKLQPRSERHQKAVRSVRGEQENTIISELMAVLIGASVTTILQLLFTLRSNNPSFWSSITLSAITGAIIGWAYRLANNLRKVTIEAIDRLESATHALEFQEEPLKMLISTKRHAKTLGLLLSDSMKEKYKFISYVDENQYLNYLKSAISVSKKYEGVQRFSVRWFARDGGAITEPYLRALREHSMSDKVRIFIIDETQEEEMKEDLANEKLMDFYWVNTGKDVKTYWITVAELNRFYNNQLQIPKDFALYDNELLIEYDAKTQTLYFEIIGVNDSRVDVFKKVTEQARLGSGAPFIIIKPRESS